MPAGAARSAASRRTSSRGWSSSARAPAISASRSARASARAASRSAPRSSRSSARRSATCRAWSSPARRRTTSICASRAARCSSVPASHPTTSMTARRARAARPTGSSATAATAAKAACTWGLSSAHVTAGLAARLQVMMTWLIKNRLAAFERQHGYDVSYMRELLAADPRRSGRLRGATKMSRYRRDVPKEPYYAAGSSATMAEDCGPCTQLGVGMALADGCTQTVIAQRDRGRRRRAARRRARSPCSSRARCSRMRPRPMPLRDEIVRRWGQRALVVARARDHRGAAVPDAEVRARPRQGVHARRRRRAADRPAAVPRWRHDRRRRRRAHRRFLVGLAYRMLGSLAEAEDVVQDAYLRWHAPSATDVASRGRTSRASSRASASTA